MRALVAVIAVIIVVSLLSLVPPRAAEWGVVAQNPAPGYGPFRLKFVEATAWPGIYRAEWWAVDENGRSWGYSPTTRFVRNPPPGTVTGSRSRFVTVFCGDCPGVNAAAYTLIALFLARWAIRRRRQGDSPEVDKTKGAATRTASRYEPQGPRVQL